MVTLHLPAWLLHYVVAPLGVLWSLFTVVNLFTARVSDETIAGINKAHPRVGHFLLMAKHFGTDLFPFLKSFVSFVTGALHILPLAVLVLALGAACSGSWEQRVHRGLIATAHVVAVSDNTTPDLYRERVAGLDGGAEFQAIDTQFHRVQDAQHALAVLLVRTEDLTDRLNGATGVQPRCLVVHALLDLAGDLGFLVATVRAFGADPPQDALGTASFLAHLAGEILPQCEGADAGVAADAGATMDP